MNKKTQEFHILQEKFNQLQKECGELQEQVNKNNTFIKELKEKNQEQENKIYHFFDLEQSLIAIKKENKELKNIYKKNELQNNIKTILHENQYRIICELKIKYDILCEINHKTVPLYSIK